jgi:hypothetical protein
MHQNHVTIRSYHLTSPRLASTAQCTGRMPLDQNVSFTLLNQAGKCGIQGFEAA